MRITITFTEQQMLAIHDEADARNNSNKLAEVVDQKVGDASARSIDFIGLLGEVAFADIFGIERDASISPRSGSVDFVSNSQNVEVKASRYPTAHLLVPAYSINGEWTTKEVCHAYVLMLVDIDQRRVTFAGWTGRNRLINPDRLGHFKGAMRRSFIMHQDDLTPLDEATAGMTVFAAKAKGNTVELTDEPTAGR